MSALARWWSEISRTFWAKAKEDNLRGARMKLAAYKPYLHGTVMDFGCGEGSFLHIARTEGRLDVLGVDVYKNSWYDFPFIQYDGTTIPLQDRSVECSTANFVLHHCPDPEHALSEMARVTSGTVLLLEDMPATPWQTYVLYQNHVLFDVFMIVLAKLSRKFQWGSDFRYRFKRDAEWKAIFRRLNLRLVKEIDIKEDYPVPFKLYVLAHESAS